MNKRFLTFQCIEAFSTHELTAHLNEYFEINDIKPQEIREMKYTVGYDFKEDMPLYSVVFLFTRAVNKSYTARTAEKLVQK